MVPPQVLLVHLDHVVMVNVVLDDLFDGSFDNPLHHHWSHHIDVVEAFDRFFDGHFHDLLNGDFDDPFDRSLHDDLGNHVLLRYDLPRPFNDNVVRNDLLDVVRHWLFYGHINELLNDLLVDHGPL